MALWNFNVDNRSMNNSSKNTECPPLYEACTLSLYQKNIFRVTGLPVDATSKEVARQAQKLQMLEEMGGGSMGPQAAFALGVAPSSDEIRAALSRMKEPEHRIIDEFFWYWPEEFGSSKSDPAIQSLIAGDESSAIQLWRKREKEGSQVAMHNMAIMYHMYAVDWTNYHVSYDIDASMEEQIKTYWRKAFDRLEILIDSDEIRDILKDRIKSVNDEALTTGFARRLFTHLPQALDQVNALAALKMAETNRMDWATFHVNFMNETHQGLDDVESTAEMVLAPTKARVEQLLESFERNADDQPARGAALARDLLATCQPLMELFDLFHGKDAHQRNDLFDKVAETILEMVISHQRATGDNKTFLAILNESLKFSNSQILRERIKKNIDIANGNLREEKVKPILERVNSITNLNATPKSKLEKFNQTVLSELPYIISSIVNEPDVINKIYDLIAGALRSISVDAYNSGGDTDTAMAAIVLAQKFAKNSELINRIIEDINLLNKNKIYSNCVFCKSSEVSDTSMMEIGMHGNVSRREGTYQTCTIKVPRCIKCSENAKSTENTGCIGAIICIVLGLIFGVAAWGPTGWFGGAFIGGVVGAIFNTKIMEQSSPLKTNFDKIKRYPPVAEQISKGWSFGAKPPQ